MLRLGRVGGRETNATPTPGNQPDGESEGGIYCSTFCFLLARRVISRTVNRKGVGARGRSNRPRFSIHGPQLHAIDQSILRENVGRHDDFIAWDDAAHAAQEGDGVFNGVVGVGGEWHEERLDGAE